MSEYSELLWVARPSEPMAAIVCKVGPVEICTNGELGNDYDDARHIVHCVNNHDRLVEALRFCVEQIENEDPDQGCLDNLAADKARALLTELENQK